MTSKKITTETIKNSYSFDEANEQAVKSILNKSEEENETVHKKRGRKKLENREKKSRYSFTLLPSVYEEALKKAGEDGKSLSEIVSILLIKYIN